MTTYTTAGFNTSTFEEVTFGLVSEAEFPELDFTVNWREQNGIFNAAFDSDADTISIDGLSFTENSPYRDVYFVRYDWDTDKTTFVLNLYDQVTMTGYWVLLGGDLFDISQASTFYSQVTAGTASNPLPGTGFASGEALPFADIPNVVETEDDLFVGTDDADWVATGVGEDTLLGNGGDDTLNGESDNDSIEGNAGHDVLAGGSGDDSLYGGSGDDDLAGGPGTDLLDGGIGNDRYVLSDENDTIVETANTGDTDRAAVAMDYTLPDFIEELELLGSDGYSATGNALDNLLIGNRGANSFEGGAGDDTMAGRGGNDTYYWRDPGDVIVERQGYGTDTVHVFGNAQAPAHVENMIVHGTGDFILSGNAMHNRIDGEAGNDLIAGGLGNDNLFGYAGDDTLIGGEGRDTMRGGSGSDTYYGGSNDTVFEEINDPGIDRYYSAQNHLSGSELRGIEILVLTEEYSFTRYAYLDGGDNTVHGSEGRDRIDGYSGDDRLEGNGHHDRLNGNSGNDTLLGGNGHDTLEGGSGDDLMSGGGGNDLYVVESEGDRIVESAGGGNDTVETRINYHLAPTLESLELYGLNATVGIGNNGDNHIRGTQYNYSYNPQVDYVLRGQGGNDSIVSSNGDDRLYGDAGNDTLSSDWGNDRLFGGSGDDSMRAGHGNDTLQGGEGADTMDGNYGQDTYFLDNVGDVIEGEGNGVSSQYIDTVYTSVSVDFNAMQAQIENIYLQGTEDLNIARHNQGRLSGELRGNAGDNTLDGSARAIDVMLGGLGNDGYVVENKRDVVIEGANAGQDGVLSYVDYALAAHVEQLQLGGNGNINGFGNGLDNAITGNEANNILGGREGNDTLTGGAGEDSFRFDRALGPDNVDTITDFSRNADVIQLHSNVFTALAGMAGGTLDAAALRGGTAAMDADDRIIYDRNTGQLFYDEDGTGVADQILFAVLSNTTLVNETVFEIL